MTEKSGNAREAEEAARKATSRLAKDAALRHEAERARVAEADARRRAEAAVERGDAALAPDAPHDGRERRVAQHGEARLHRVHLREQVSATVVIS